MFLPMFLFL
ncbi:hypothetical protein D039_5100A, partial [Vibrio parahaemolyticus EKP-028]